MRKNPLYLSILVLIFFAAMISFPPLKAMAENRHRSDHKLLTLEVTPTATPDFSIILELPENPSQVELGRHSYWHNCMPCHGDHGQGLTDAWRMTWPEDHRECWNRGCHGGRIEDAGFPIPRNVPPIFDASYVQNRFPTEITLFEYLQTTHPPQNPGCLQEDDYWSLTAYVLYETDQILEGERVGPKSPTQVSESFNSTLLVALGFILTLFLGLWASIRIKPDH